jgi:hypothetical protein
VIYFNNDLTTFTVGLACFAAGLCAHQVMRHLLIFVRSRRPGFGLPSELTTGLELLKNYGVQDIDLMTTKDDEHVLGMVVHLGDREVPPDVQTTLCGTGWKRIPGLNHWVYDCTSGL